MNLQFTNFQSNGNGTNSFDENPITIGDCILAGWCLGGLQLIKTGEIYDFSQKF